MFTFLCHDLLLACDTLLSPSSEPSVCFHRNVCVSVSVCLASELVNQTVGVLNANSFKTVKATDFKFDMRVSSVSPDMIT